MYLSIKAKVRVSSVMFDDQNFHIVLINNLIKDVIRKPSKINSGNILSDDWI